MKNTEFLISSEAGRILNLSAAGVRRLEGLGQLPALRTPTGMRLFRRHEVVRLANARAARANRPRPNALEGAAK
jgi:DNA-binding transcriptional MerR regulator